MRLFFFFRERFCDFFFFGPFFLANNHGHATFVCDISLSTNICDFFFCDFPDQPTDHGHAECDEEDGDVSAEGVVVGAEAAGEEVHAGVQAVLAQGLEQR